MNSVWAYRFNESADTIQRTVNTETQFLNSQSKGASPPLRIQNLPTTRCYNVSTNRRIADSFTMSDRKSLNWLRQRTRL